MNTAGLIAVLRRPTYKVGSWMGVWELDFGRGSHYELIRGATVPKVHKQHGRSQTPALLLGVWVWARARQRAPSWPTASRHPGPWVFNELPQLATFQKGGQTMLLGDLSASCGAPLEEAPWKLVPGFLWTSPHVLFLLADFTLYSFPVTSYNQE